LHAVEAKVVQYFRLRMLSKSRQMHKNADMRYPTKANATRSFFTNIVSPGWAPLADGRIGPA
jgi:hypothetical protein